MSGSESEGHGATSASGEHPSATAASGGHHGVGDHSGSMFRVGDNVELTRVLGMVSILVVCVMILERLLHRLEHKLHKYPKYHEMMTKVFGELMILGLIGLGIKILKELGKLDAYSKPSIAFQVADLTIFIVAIALILQAIVVFFRLRRKNIQADKAELVTTQHLAEFVGRTKRPTWWDEVVGRFTYGRRENLTKIMKADIPEVVQLRILRHNFLKSYGLPQIFPFSKYLRQAQDNQISHMIEVEISTWIVLLLIAWCMNGVSKFVLHHYDTEYSIVISFFIFSWCSVLLHIAIAIYFTWAVNKLVNQAVDAHSPNADRYLHLNEIAEIEAQAADRDMATDAIAVMEQVREMEQMKRVKRKRNILSEHDTGFQLVGTVFRKVQSKTKSKKHAPTVEEGIKAAQGEGSVAVGTATPVQLPKIQLRWFSRKAWHFVVMSTLMLNGLYCALFCQCVIYQMTSIYHEHGGFIAVMLPLPLFINMLIFQPRILRNFILVSSIFRIDDTALGDVIDHFTETVQLRASFVESIHEYLASSNQTVTDVRNEFEARDEDKTGFLDLEEVRLVLWRFGFELSYFRFNSVAKLLFDFHGINIEYAQVVKLLEAGNVDGVQALARAKSPSHGESPNARSQVTQDDTSRRNESLLRAQSVAASSLYRMYVDDPIVQQPNLQSSPSDHAEHVAL